MACKRHRCPDQGRRDARFYDELVIILLAGCLGRLVTVSALPRSGTHPSERVFMKLFMLGAAALFITTSVFAADNTSVIHDTTGFYVNLDVAKVLSSTDTYGQCGVVPAQLRYLDHQGREHVLDYRVLAIGCPNDN
jgi:hypothetical protein